MRDISSHVYDLRNEFLGSLPVLFPRLRDDQPNVFIQAKSQLIDFINSETDPISIHRWFIHYMMGLDKQDIFNFVIFKINKGSVITSRIVKRMSGLGIPIGNKEKFGYVICTSDEIGYQRIAERSYEIGYFLQSQDTKSPLKIDYAYYAEWISSLEDLLSEVDPLPSKFGNIKYKKEFHSKTLNFVDNPLKMLASMKLAKYNLATLLKSYEEIAEKIILEEVFDMASETIDHHQILEEILVDNYDYDQILEEILVDNYDYDQTLEGLLEQSLEEMICS